MIKKNHLKLCASKFGVLSVSWGEGVIFIKNGKPFLSESIWREYCRMHANTGMDLTREMFWLVSIEDVLAAAFMWLEDKGSYDLNKTNIEIIKIIKRMAEIAREYNIEMILELFDWCGVKKDEYKKYNPWTNNIQDVNGWWTSKAWPYVKKWVKQVVIVAKVKHLSLCNEPPDSPAGMARTFGEFLWKLDRYLIDQLKVDYSNIILGYFFGGAVWDRFQDFQKKASDNEDIKYNSYTVIHKLSKDKTDILVEGNYHRAIMASFDGVKPRPNIAETREIAKDFFARAKSKNAMLEILTCHDHGGYDNAGEGLSLAYKDIYGHYPVNYGKFEKPVKPEPIPDPEPIPKPDPGPEPKKEVKKMTVKSVGDFFWKWIKKFFIDLFKQWRILYFIIGAIIGGLLF